MFQIILRNSSSSHFTYVTAALCNTLNSRGIKTILYGNDDWPSTFCRFEKLELFKISKNSIVILIGFNKPTIFKAVLPSLLFFTHGRKRRLIQILESIPEIIHALLKIYFCNVKVISSTSFLNFHQLVDKEKCFSKDEDVYLDICEENDIHNLLINSKGEINLKGAITSPYYFKNKVLPLFLDHKFFIHGNQQTYSENIINKIKFCEILDQLILFHEKNL